ADVKLTSVGIALLGVLPMGAFVEPDDEELEKRSMIEKVRVFVTGSGANFVLMFLAFIVFILFQPVVAQYTQYTQYYVVYVGNNTEYSGATVLAIRGIPVDKLDYENLPYKAGDNVTVEMDKGTFTAVVNDNGKVGVVEKMMITNLFVSSVFNVIVLLIVLNFYIAAFNLIPVSILDGYHILRAVVGEKNVKYLSYES
ncbi:site-2 protease family protein, partial [Candidatus Micrarchaeota archaeon]|nr:site-2 protease family protein [Candidatus Micrarchaeota archaeon]